MGVKLLGKIKIYDIAKKLGLTSKEVLDIAKKLNIESVPAVFVNGKKVENALDYEALKKMIDSELANKEK